MNIEHINSNISRLTLPYKDIYTTVYAVKTDDGVLLFDSGSFDDDATNYILPFLHELSITLDDLKYIYISHNHTDHAGGLSGMLKYFPDAVIVSKCQSLKDKFDGFNVRIVDEDDLLLNVLKIISIPGHTIDSSAVLDTRSNTLITGDCLQLYGIFGSGKWACNVGFPDLHIKAIEKLRGMKIETILTAHDYHPFGYKYEGWENINQALDACIEPLINIKTMIMENPESSSEEIAEMYNSKSNLPTLGAHVVEAIRNKLI